MSKKYTPFEIKRQLIAALVVVALLLGIIVTVVVSYTFNRSSLFKDQDFARAIAEALDVHAKDLTPEMLEQYDSLTFYVDIGFAPVGSNSVYSVYAIPTIVLGLPEYTDELIAALDAPEEDEEDEEEDQDEETGDESGDESLSGGEPVDESTDESSDESEAQEEEEKNYLAVYYQLKNLDDVHLFKNLRILSALDYSNIYSMRQLLFADVCDVRYVGRFVGGR